MTIFHTHSTNPGPVLLAQRQYDNGFSLLEVMVTLVIWSFGLLAVAGLLVRGVSNIAATESTAKASQLAGDMADRLRANSAVAVTPGNTYIRSYGSPKPADSGVPERDLNAWLTALAAQLPQGDGQISLDSPNRKMIIGVHWSNCMGTLSDADQAACKSNSATAFKAVSFEIRL